MCVCVCVCVVSELHSVEGQTKLPFRLQKERFWFKSNSQSHLFV